MGDEQSLDVFISRLARKIVALYPNNCADEEDYIQAGHLKLAEINSGGYEQRDCRAYAIITIARAMREAALGAMCSASAPRRIKRMVHRMEMFVSAGKTQKDICEELQIDNGIFILLRSMIGTKSLQQLFEEPNHLREPFSVVDDMLSSSGLTKKEKAFLQAHSDGDIASLGMTRRQRWSLAKGLRPKLTRSGYGS